MEPQNLYPLDELKSLDDQVELVSDLAGLKPIFFRLDEIAKQHPSDFEIQMAVGDIKQHLVNRGTKLKQPPAPAEPPAPPAAPFPTVEQAAPPPFLKDEPASPPLPSSAFPIPTATQTVLPQAPPPPPERLSTVHTTAGHPPPPVLPLPSQVLPLPSQKSRVPPKPPNPAVKWKRSLWIGAIAGAIVAAVGITLLVHAHRRTLTPGGGAVQVQIATVPPGASIRINGQEKCTSNCNISLPPGNYQVTAFLDGYETAASGISLAAGRPSSVSFPLEPQPQSLRILTDLNSGKVQVDGQPPADLQGGEFVLDKILPGSHTVKLTGRSGQATFSFQIADAKAPEVASGFAVKNLDAVLISSLGNHAKVIANSGPQKLTVNGQAEADTGPAGVDVQHFQSGSDELVIGEGKDQHSVQESFGPAPMLTAIFRSDVNAGTLIVSTGEDDVRVFLNNKEYPRRTRRGQLRIQTIGKVAVRVIKDGFDSPAVQTAEVRKGGETRLEFTLKETPKVASLQISGGIPGAEVLIDNRSLGVLGPGGGIFRGSIPPGNHTIELRHDRFVTRSLQRKFTAGQTVVISGADATLAELHLPPPPKKLPPPAPVKLAPPPPKPGTMADWENNAVWHRENGEWTHQGEGFLAYKLPANGVFTFTVELLKGGGLFHSGKIRWCLNYIDDKNYALFEMDNKNFWAKVVQNGKTFERTKTPLKDLDKQKQFTIQIDVTPEHIVHKIFAGGEWVNLDAWAETGRNFSKGKFGFLMQGDDEIGIRSFKFQPK